MQICDADIYLLMSPLLLACRWLICHNVLKRSYVCVCMGRGRCTVFPSSNEGGYKSHCIISTPYALLKFSYLLKGPIFKCSLTEAKGTIYQKAI